MQLKFLFPDLVGGGLLSGPKNNLYSPTPRFVAIHMHNFIGGEDVILARSEDDRFG